MTTALLRLAEPCGRVDGAAALAREVGADEVLAFVLDPDVHVLVPAPGFPQTVCGGPSWRKFLVACSRAPRHTAVVELPIGQLRDACALQLNGAALVLLGGGGCTHAVDAIVPFLPMLAHVFGTEMRVRVAEAAVSQAEVATRRVMALVEALEAARADAWKLNAQLTEEHRQRDNFLAMLAHELRNPLAPLVSTLAFLRLNGVGGAWDHLDLMERQVRQLCCMVDDLLDVSRVRHGKIELRMQPVSIADAIAAAIETSRPVVDTKGHRLEVGAIDPAWVVRGDPMRLTQVFSNLLHNAAKYTDPGGLIRVAVQSHGREVAVSISDTGIGIDPDILPKVFDLFVQAPVSLDRAQGGLGIGLTLVRSLIEAHAGSVRAHSDGPRRGSTFEVRLPLSLADDRSAPPSAPELHGPSTSARVLIIDDNRDLTRSLAMLLQAMGHRVDTAHTALHAMQIARDVDPDLVLLDIGLPHLDGFEAAPRLRTLLRPDVPLVAMTGYGSPEDRRRSSSAGFDAHLVKPVTLDALVELLAHRSKPALEEPPRG